VFSFGAPSVSLTTRLSCGAKSLNFLRGTALAKSIGDTGKNLVDTISGRGDEDNRSEQPGDEAAVGAGRLGVAQRRNLVGVAGTEVHSR
jgi:hypothetical protein